MDAKIEANQKRIIFWNQFHKFLNQAKQNHWRNKFQNYTGIYNSADELEISDLDELVIELSFKIKVKDKSTYQVNMMIDLDDVSEKNDSITAGIQYDHRYTNNGLLTMKDLMTNKEILCETELDEIMGFLSSETIDFNNISQYAVLDYLNDPKDGDYLQIEIK